MSQGDKTLDDLISEALDAEDRELLDQYGKEPGFFVQALSIFRGSLGWVMAVVMLLVFVFVGLTLWTGLNFFSTTDPVMSLRWGLSAVVCANVILFLRSVLMQQISTNRVMREIKRLELQVARQHKDAN